jgi:hypothetical protein
MKRRTEIMIETERTLVTPAHGPNSRKSQWCEDCNADTKHVSLDEASKILCLSSTSILRLMGAECQHVNQKGAGNIFVCLNSLLVEVMLSLTIDVKAENATYLQSTI